MILIQKILVGIDFSEHAGVALKYAAEFARTFNAEVIACHVVEPPDMLSQLPPGGEFYFPPNLTQTQQESSQTQCERLLAEAGVARGRVITPAGSPFLEIVRAAKEEDADLIVMGTHGRGAVAHILMGSVAERVVRKAPCPVLTVRSGEHEFVMP
jgi:nucleotide-binding universal stress UspA family protein